MRILTSVAAWLLLAGGFAARAGAQTVTAVVSSPSESITPADLDAGTAKTVFTTITVTLTGCTNDNNASTSRCSVWMSATPNSSSSNPIRNVVMNWGFSTANCTNAVRNGNTPSTADPSVLDVTESGSQSGSANIVVCIRSSALTWASPRTTFTPVFSFGWRRR